jgi:magnesium transporter
MNTHVPGEQSFTGFWVVIGVMIVVLVGMLTLFRKRGWL